MISNNKTTQDPLTQRLSDEAQLDRPPFDAPLHERIMRAVRRDEPQRSADAPASIRWPVYAAIAAGFVIACAIGLMSVTNSPRDARRPSDRVAVAVNDVGAYENDKSAAQLLTRVMGPQPLVAQTAEFVQAWSELNDEAATALVLIDRFAVRFALARD